MFRRIERHEESGLGLPYPVTLINAAEEEIDENGEQIGIRIPNLEGLAAVVVLARCLWPYDLAGAEVRFIRRVLGYTQQELAARLVMRPETLSRWESRKEDQNPSDRPVGEWADKSLRMLAALELSSKAPGSAVDPQDITALRIRLRDPNTWPTVVAEQVVVRTDGHRRLEWDAMPQAA
jgi:transcriptional regulator with XRE-family HTH domain